MATFIPVPIAQAVLTTTDTAVWTADGTYLVKAVRLCNTGTACTVNWSLIPPGGTIGDGTHRQISGFALNANEVIDDEPNQIVNTGWKLAAFASVGSDVVLTVSGYKYA